MIHSKMTGKTYTSTEALDIAELMAAYDKHVTATGTEPPKPTRSKSRMLANAMSEGGLPGYRGC